MILFIVEGIVTYRTKELAFQHISTFLKPGGYLIFGDPNKTGGFQNMLQRFAVYKFAKTPDEMVDISEYFFKEDIDRSEKLFQEQEEQSSSIVGLFKVKMIRQWRKLGIG